MGSVMKAIADVSVNSFDKKVLTAFAYSCRSQDEDLVNFKPSNQLVTLNACHDFKSTLNEQILESKRISERYKDGRIGFGIQAIVPLFCSLVPNSLIVGEVRKTVHEQQSLTCSNMAASLGKNWIFDGKRVNWIAIGTSGDHPCITLTSLHDTVKVTVISKTYFFKDTEELMAKIEENMSES